MLPNTVPRGECRVAEKFREAVKALPEPVPTISAGVGNWEPGISAEELVHRADQALYRAKEAGRDRVEIFGRRQGGNQ